MCGYSHIPVVVFILDLKSPTVNPNSFNLCCLQNNIYKFIPAITDIPRQLKAAINLAELLPWLIRSPEHSPLQILLKEVN